MSCSSQQPSPLCITMWAVVVVLLHHMVMLLVRMFSTGVEVGEDPRLNSPCPLSAPGGAGPNNMTQHVHLIITKDLKTVFLPQGSDITRSP